MPRGARIDVGGYVYHALNRANGKARIFTNPPDYAAFETIVGRAIEKVEMRLMAYCVMPNHWHLVLWPRQDGDLARFMHAITMSHTQALHAHRGTVGQGHVYQSRYKSFLVDSEGYFLNLCRYVERNPLRAGLVDRAQDWAWSSLARREKETADASFALTPWPVTRPRGWLRLVNQPMTEAEEASLQTSINRGRPYGRKSWVAEVTKRFGLESTIRPRGRPRKRTP